MSSILLLFFVRAIVTTSAFPLNNLVDFLINLKEIYHPFRIDAFTCLSYEDKTFLSRNLPFQLKFESIETSSTFMMASGLSHFSTFLIDIRCENALDFLHRPEMKSFYRHPYRWIMLGHSHSHVPQIEALIDSSILFVEDDYQLWNFYRIRPSSPYIFEYVGKWTPKGLERNQTDLILSRRRKNLRKTPLQTTIVITQDRSMDHLNDYKEKHIDSIAKANFLVTKILVESVNASLVYNRANTWGYRNPETGNWSGMIGELTSGRSDIGGTALFIQQNRINIIEYLSMVIPTKSGFIFREPPLSSVTNIYLLPFTNLVWIATGCLVILAVLLIFVALTIIQKHPVEFKDTQESFSRFTDGFLVGISAISQMGLILQPKSVSARIIFLLVALVFLYTSYTANIVALLQSTTKDITTLTDLLNSNLETALDDNPYNRYYFPTATEPIRKKIYETKVLPAKGGTFLNTTTGIDRIRAGSFAFHLELSVAYELIERTFYEHEKCNLQTIEYIQVNDPWYAIQKNSSFKEILKVNLFKIREHGLQARENAKIYTKHPSCTAHGQNFGSVRLQECYGAFVILASGFGSAFLFFVLETFWSNARICRI